MTIPHPLFGNNSSDAMPVIASIAAGISFLTLLANIYFFYKNKESSRKSGKNAEKAANAAAEANTHAQEANKHLAEANILHAQANITGGQAVQIASAQFEANLAAQIREARAPIEEIHRKLVEVTQGKTKFTVAEKREVESITKNLKSCVEAMLTQYEVGCRIYLTGKCDKESFKRTYFTPIRELCTSKEPIMASILHPRDTCPFEAIWKVYDEWHKLEK